MQGFQQGLWTALGEARGGHFESAEGIAVSLRAVTFAGSRQQEGEPPPSTDALNP